MDSQCHWGSQLVIHLWLSLHTTQANGEIKPRADRLLLTLVASEALYPSVPEGRGIAAGSGPVAPAAAEAVIMVGLSPCACTVFPMATVEMACLKINCS